MATEQSGNELQFISGCSSWNILPDLVAFQALVLSCFHNAQRVCPNPSRLAQRLGEATAHPERIVVFIGFPSECWGRHDDRLSVHDHLYISFSPVVPTVPNNRDLCVHFLFPYHTSMLLVSLPTACP